MALAMGGIALVPMVLVAAAAGQKGAAPAAAFGGLLLVLFAFVGVLFVVKAILLIFAGRSLRRRSGYVLAMIAACLALINFPFGTALGVATFVILQKPGVKARFRA
jgi:Na+/H+ antiporter NhaB